MARSPSARNLVIGSPVSHAHHRMRASVVLAMVAVAAVSSSAFSVGYAAAPPGDLNSLSVQPTSVATQAAARSSTRAGHHSVAAKRTKRASAAPVTPPNGTCGFCVIAPSGRSLAITGNGNLAVIGGNLIDDSSGKPAIAVTGNGSLIAPSVGVVGSVSTTGKGTIQNLTTGIGAITDPLATLAVPSIPRPNPVPSVNVSGTTHQTISPGVYQKISVSGQAVLTLNAGNYVVLSQFFASGGGQLVGAGITLYLACAAYPSPCSPGQAGASLALTGNGLFNLSAPTSTCVPLTIFADRNNTSTITLTGNAGDRILGGIYGASASLSLAGNGSVFQAGTQIVVGRASSHRIQRGFSHRQLDLERGSANSRAGVTRPGYSGHDAILPGLTYLQRQAAPKPAHLRACHGTECDQRDDAN